MSDMINLVISPTGTILTTRTRTDPRTPDSAVIKEGRHSLIPMANWNRYNVKEKDELICVHDCESTSQTAFFITGPIDEKCPYCGITAPEKIQTLFVLHNGHY